MLMLYIASCILELVLFLPFVWRYRKLIVPIIVAAASFSIAALVALKPSVLYFGLLFLTAYRMFNMLRVVEGRMHQDYLYRATRRTTLWLTAYQAIYTTVLLMALHFFSLSQLLLFASTVVAVVSGLALLITLNNIRKTRHQAVLENYADKELPTVTVAIPARNETQDLEDCIRSILSNDYPKFEVIVLDDCSGDKTPEIIRSFAHDGVRFIEGAEPNENWLAKNQAYERLAEEASGELLLFCGVDVRFGPQTIRALVTTLLNRNKDMISILPRRLTGGLTSAFVQSMRYWWELVLPRRPFNRPPVLSTCWLIRHKTLKKLGGFKAVSHSVLPEGYFAREIVKTDGYSFVRADDVLDVQTRKNATEQKETAIRTNYPLLRRRPEWVALVSVINIFGMVAPFALALTALWNGLGPLQVLALVSCCFLTLIQLSITAISNPPNLLLALINTPFAALTEFVLGYASMFQYELSTVEWKGRNVCIPVMHVIPNLPKI